MILDEIVFHNYGVYRGTQMLSLTPPSSDKPIILLGGLNGGGKTTFLDGLQLALYGKSAHCSNRGELGYDEFLRRSVHRGAYHEESGIEVAFRHTTEGQEHAYRVHRFWKQNGKGVKETVQVRCDGAVDSLLSEHWEEHVETFIPLGISDLFFFDGEKIEQLADINNSSRVLSTAIHSLLGIELVDRLSADLLVLERRKRIVARSDTTKKTIADFEADVNRLQTLQENTLLERGSAQNELDLAEKSLRKIQDRFRLEGGELFLQREELHSQHAIVEARVYQAEQDLRELTAGALPLSLVDKLLISVDKQAERELKIEESRLLRKIVKQRDRHLLCFLKRSGVSSRLIAAVSQFCEKDRNGSKIADRSFPYLLLDAKGQQEIRSLRRVFLPDALRRSKELTSLIIELKEQAVNLEQKLAAVPNAESLELLRQQISAAETNVYQRKARVETLDAKLTQLQNDKERKNATLVALIESDIEEQVKHADDVRTLQYSEKVRGTLNKFRLAVVQRHVSRIEQLMFDSFQQLLRKTTLISEIKINPDKFSIELHAADGKPLSPDRLSAGERQLLAVSMLWGLARASGRPLPTIIDTPLGRLDSVHRAHLVERYFPFASHQVLLLSTDKEIDEAFYEKLKPRIGRTYRLDFSDETNATQIRPGYFWRQ